MNRTLESPFLDAELSELDAEPALDPRAFTLVSESPFLDAFSMGAEEDLNPPETSAPNFRATTTSSGRRKTRNRDSSSRRINRASPQQRPTH